MRSLIPLIALVLLLPFFASAETGFWAPTVSILPSPVVQATKGVFEVTVAGGQPRAFSLAEVGEMALKIPAMVASGQISVAEKITYESQFDRCRKARLDPCYLMLMTARSSAFVVEGTIATALHAVGHYMSGVLKLPSNQSLSRDQKIKLLEQLSIPVVISDGTGDLLTDLKVAKVFGEAIDAIVDGEDVPAVLDAVLLSGSAINGLLTLKRARSSATPGSEVFIAGYPKRTQDRQSKVGVPDADGQLRVTKGKALSLDDGYRRQGRDAAALFNSKQRTIFSQYLILSDADANVGLNGGPMMNQLGEVVGIFGEGWPDNDAYAPNKMANGVQISRLLD